MPGTALLQVSRDRRIGRRRLEQLERALAGRNDVRAHALRRAPLPALRSRVRARRDRTPARRRCPRRRSRCGRGWLSSVPAGRCAPPVTRSIVGDAVYGSSSRAAMRSTSRSSSPAGRASFEILQEPLRQQVAQPIRLSVTPAGRGAAARVRAEPPIAAQSSAMPSPAVATVFRIGGRHSPAAAGCSARFAAIACTSLSAPSRSALLTTKMSAISMMPALSACTSSPVPGTSITIETSAVRAMSTSSWPTPTVSMMTMSLPAASRMRATSPVARARPPR